MASSIQEEISDAETDTKAEDDKVAGGAVEENDDCTSLDKVKKLVSAVYVKARKENIPVDPEDQVYPIFEDALLETPWNVKLWTEYMITMERNECEMSEIVLVFEKALTVSFRKSEDFKDIWLVYIDCLRRHTDWSDEKQVSSLDKTFDVCTEYLGNIPDSDPELTILKYWALIQAKHIGNITLARELWDGIAEKQGLKHSHTCKFWTEYIEFERLYGEGDDEAYRNLLHRAVQQTRDYPEMIAERLIRFERQEGDCIKKLVDSEAKCRAALARHEKFKRDRDVTGAEKRPRPQPNEGLSKKARQRKRRKEMERQNDGNSNDEVNNQSIVAQQKSEGEQIATTSGTTVSTNNRNQENSSSGSSRERLINPMLPRSVANKRRT